MGTTYAECFLSTMDPRRDLDQFPRTARRSIERARLRSCRAAPSRHRAEKLFVASEKVSALPMKASDYVRRNLRFTAVLRMSTSAGYLERAGKSCAFSRRTPRISKAGEIAQRFALSTPNLPSPRRNVDASNFADLIGRSVA